MQVSHGERTELSLIFGPFAFHILPNNTAETIQDCKTGNGLEIFTDTLPIPLCFICLTLVGLLSYSETENVKSLDLRVNDY